MMLNVTEAINALCIEKRAFINGDFVKAIDGRVISKVSPVDGRDLTGISACNKKDINYAVHFAKLSYDSKVWLNKDPHEKKAVMLKLADLMNKNKEELALLDTLETGRSFKNYFFDSIPKAIEALRYFAESVDKYYDYSTPRRVDSFSVITREALGVVGIIVPWNDPLVVSMWKISPALLMGNSVIVKPAEQSSLSILKVASLAVDAGIPPGVFNVVTGYGDIAGKALALHKDVSAIFFTGSSSVGKLIMQYAGRSNMKRVGLECGGKSPFIISEKCKSLKKAAQVLAKNIFYNQGQICSAPSRVLVHNSLIDEFMGYLKDECALYVPDNPFSLCSEVGCCVSSVQKNRVMEFINDSIKLGADIYTPEPTKWFEHNGHTAILPTVVTNVSLKSKIVNEEIFGPVVVVIGFNMLDDAIKIANNTKYGLAAAIWTEDLKEAHQASRELQCGIVHINSYGDDDNSVPFGGTKESGIGKDKSMFAFDEYSYLKTTWVNVNV